jgi:hypothetical protein
MRLLSETQGLRRGPAPRCEIFWPSARPRLQGGAALRSATVEHVASLTGAHSVLYFAGIVCCSRMSTPAPFGPSHNCMAFAEIQARCGTFPKKSMW